MLIEIIYTGVQNKKWNSVKIPVHDLMGLTTALKKKSRNFEAYICRWGCLYIRANVYIIYL